MSAVRMKAGVVDICSMNAHTPSPWHWVGEGLLINEEGDEIIAGDLFDTPQFPEANAAFIVRACNAHDELVAALKECLNQLEHEATWHGSNEPLQDAINSARAALAKVQAQPIKEAAQ